jgi:hypothetical protein
MPAQPQQLLAGMMEALWSNNFQSSCGFKYLRRITASQTVLGHDDCPFFDINGNHDCGDIHTRLNTVPNCSHGATISFTPSTTVAASDTSGQGQATTVAASDTSGQGQARTVSGSLTVTVSDPAAFKTNSAVRTALQEAIAENHDNINADMIEIVSLSDARRLSDERRLTGDVNVNYNINIPASSTNVVTPTTASMQAAQTAMQSSLVSRLQQNGVSGISVTGLTANAVTVQTVNDESTNSAMAGKLSLAAAVTAMACM